MDSTPPEQQHVQTSINVADEAGRLSEDQERLLTIPTLPPSLPTPLVDDTFSMESLLEAAALRTEQAEKERLDKLNKEKERLDAQLKEMQDRLEAAEKKTEELQAKRRSQVLTR